MDYLSASAIVQFSALFWYRVWPRDRGTISRRNFPPNVSYSEQYSYWNVFYHEMDQSTYSIKNILDFIKFYQRTPSEKMKVSWSQKYIESYPNHFWEIPYWHYMYYEDLFTMGLRLKYLQIYKYFIRRQIWREYTSI